MFGLENSAILPKQKAATPYNYRGAKVHFVDLLNAGETKATCFRCKRSLPYQQFQPLFAVSDLKSMKVSVRRQVALHPHCWTCREQAMGEWTSHPQYSPELDRYWSAAIARIKGAAKGRGLIVAVDKDDLLGLYLQQDRRCALTGLEMDWRAKGGAGRGKRALTAPSVDRIDSQGNYTLDNIQIVMNAINVMKSDMTTEQFILLCEQVSAHRLMG